MICNIFQKFLLIVWTFRSLSRSWQGERYGTGGRPLLLAPPLISLKGVCNLLGFMSKRLCCTYTQEMCHEKFEYCSIKKYTKLIFPLYLPLQTLILIFVNSNFEFSFSIFSLNLILWGWRILCRISGVLLNIQKQEKFLNF